VLTAENLPLLPRCGAIIRTGSGTDNIPVAAATERGIIVANTPDALTDAVADHTIGLLLDVVRQISAQDRAVRGGAWDRRRYGPRWHIQGQTLGLIGFGRIPRLVARKLAGFALTYLAYDPYVGAGEMAAQGVQAAGLDDLLARSDFVLVHCPLTRETWHLLGERELRLMQRTATLINAARGSVIDEPVLVRALQEGWIAGAGLDVLEQEPPDWSNPLLQLDNVVITPHMAALSDEYLPNSWRLSVDTATALAQRRWPRSHVNHEVRPRWEMS
jgi:D-3-phosphoglycerate dehydrogenase